MRKFNKAEILENGVLQIREVEQLELKDGSVIDGGFYRYTLAPDMDINTIECEKCKSLAITLWTPEVIEAYKASIEAQH